MIQLSIHCQKSTIIWFMEVFFVIVRNVFYWIALFKQNWRFFKIRNLIDWIWWKVLIENSMSCYMFSFAEETLKDTSHLFLNQLDCIFNLNKLTQALNYQLKTISLSSKRRHTILPEQHWAINFLGSPFCILTMSQCNLLFAINDVLKIFSSW